MRLVATVILFMVGLSLAAGLADVLGSSYIPPGGAVTAAGEAKVALPGSNLSAFGDLVSVGMTPTFQADFVYGINSQLGSTTTANGGTVDSAASVGLRVQTGTHAAGSGHYESRRPASYRPGQGVIMRFTAVFSACAASSTQFAGAGNNTTDGIGVGCNGATFGVRHLNAGSDSWVAQAAWNGDKLDGTGPSGMVLDKTKGNVYQIVYPYLGYGVISLWIQDPMTARWVLMHSFRYPNAHTTTELANPSLHFQAHAENATSR
jgi:hypothetical protein